MRQCALRTVVLSLALLSRITYAAVTPEAAVVKAVNDLRSGNGSVTLKHPRYESAWTRDGFRMKAARGPEWNWTLQSVTSGAADIAIDHGALPSANQDALRVQYARGAIVEQYICNARTVEQQFVIPARVNAGRDDVTIDAAVRSDGRFAARRTGWTWSNATGAITLGQVTVTDRNGTNIAAKMSVTANHVRITVDGAALGRATYPVTVDPEVGANDFRVSNLGTDGDGSDVSRPAVAFNGSTEYLVVYAGFTGGENEIWAKRVNAITGAPIGSDYRISDMGGVGTGTTYSVNNPDVVYNATSNEYLVVWRGDDNVAPLIDNDFEIFGQRIDGTTGAEIGANDFRISFMGANGDTASFADDPAVAWDSINNRYLVVWSGDDSSVVDDEQEIWGRILNSDGTSFSADEIRITNVGTDGDIMRGAREPDVAFDTVNGRYAVVYYADQDADNAFDIFGQLVTVTGTKSGSQFRVSDMGNLNTDTAFSAFGPRIAFNPNAVEYVVVWHGDDNVPGDGENEIFCQRINATTTAEVGTNDKRISTAGPAGNINQGAFYPDVAYCAATNRYLVVWYGDYVIDNENEIWGQVLAADGTEIGTDMQLSDAGPPGNTSYIQQYAQLVFNGTTAFIVWRGMDDFGAAIAEGEVLGQFFDMTPSPYVIDDFSIAQGPLTASSAPATVNDSNADSLAVHFGGERNLRIGASSVGGGSMTVQVTGGSLVFNRPAGSAGEIAVWWDGDNDTSTFDPNTGPAFDLTGGGILDKLVLAVDSSSSASNLLRIDVWTDGTNYSEALVALPTAGGIVDVPYKNFATGGGAGATFTAVRAIYVSTYTTSGAWSASISSISAAAPVSTRDFDGNVKSDVLWHNISTGANYIYFMNGLSIISQDFVNQVPDLTWTIVATGDFNGDHQTDILWRNTSTGQNYVYLMNGSKIGANGIINTIADQSWTVAATADFDGDGKSDILWRNTSTGANYIYLMDGLTITSQLYMNTVADQSWQVVGTGDFNADSKADILWRNSANGQDYVYLMNGATIGANGIINTIPDQNWRVAGIGDFNADGKSDILWHNIATGASYIYFMNGLSIIQQDFVNTVADLNWQIVSTGDYNGDGVADILWRHNVTGQNYMYIMAGSAIGPNGVINTIADPNWRAVKPLGN